MNAEVARYRGRSISVEDVAFIRNFISQHPNLSRWKLSRELCEAWQWKQANGALCDMLCRSLLLVLHRAGQIQLPAVRRPMRNYVTERLRPGPVVPDNRPVVKPLRELQPWIEIHQVRRTRQEPLFKALLEQHHYLGFRQPVGEHLKFLVTVRGQAIACLAFSSAPRHLAPRDQFIGWNAEARRRNLRFLAYNSRYLILPWVQVEHLASHLLGRVARQISQAWEEVYAHPIYMLETFVDPARFRGTCYRAANWVSVGRTTGRGKNDLTHKPNRPIKEILAYPLTPRFRELLAE